METIEPHVCTGQRWTVCTWALAMGYTDLCIGALYPTDERAEIVTGFKLVDLKNNMYTKRDNAEMNLFNFQIFEVWSVELWIATVCILPFLAFVVRFVGGYYTGFIMEPMNVMEEFGNTFFWACGMFLDVIYPQSMPTPLAKVMLIVFELAQCFLLATITASLTRVLLVDTSTAISNVEELQTAGGTICFRYSTQGVMFLQNYPNFPVEKIYADDVCEGDCMDFSKKLASGDCIAYGETETQMKKNHAKALSCEWSAVELLWSTQFWMPASEHVYDTFHAIWGQMYNDGTLTKHRLENLISAGLSSSMCSESVEITTTALSFDQVSGIFIVPMMIAVACLLLDCIGCNRRESVALGQTDLGFRAQRSFVEGISTYTSAEESA